MFLITAFCGSSTSSNIECTYGYNDFHVVDFIYRCLVNNNPNILTEKSAELNKINGTHQDKKMNNDVLGFSAKYETIQFFPKGLDKFFKNLKIIEIKSCGLKEIHQSDLKVFPDLVNFYLSYNEIEVIEEGLFDFNPNLEAVGFWEENNIIHIDPNVFDHLNKLTYFQFSFAICVNEDVKDSRDKVQEAIKVVKSNCSNSEFLSLEIQIKNLENESKTLNSSEFNTNFENFEKTFKNSKFLKFRPLSYKFQNLKLSFGCPNCVNFGKSLRGTIIFVIFLPLIFHFLRTFNFS